MAANSCLDHVAIAVSSIAKALPLYKALGCVIGDQEKVLEQGVLTQFIDTGEAKIELLEPLSPDTPVGKFIAKRGEGIHHICLRVTNIEASLKSLKDKGYKLINEKPVKGAHNCLVAFVHPSSTGGVLLELSQKQS